METQTLATEIRHTCGKNAARQLRAQGLLPAVFYGPKSEPVALSVPPKDLIAALSTDYRRNVIFKLSIEGEEKLAMIRELQVHPVTRDLLHVDFYHVDLERPVDVFVPVVTKGRARGVVAGGDLNLVFRELPVHAKPVDVPAVIEVNVTPLQINEFYRVKDLPLPEGVRVPLDPERHVITVTMGRRRVAQEGEEAAKAG